MWAVRGTGIQVCQCLTQLSLHRAALGASLQSYMVGTHCSKWHTMLSYFPLAAVREPSKGLQWPGKGCAQVQTKILPWVPNFSSPGRNSNLVLWWTTPCQERFSELQAFISHLTCYLSNIVWHHWFFQCLQQNDFIIKAFTFSSTTSDFASVMFLIMKNMAYFRW